MKIKLITLFVFLLASFAKGNDTLGSSALHKSEIKSVRINENSETTRLVFEVNGEIDYKVFSLTNPSRLIIDLNNITSKPLLDDLSKNHGPIINVRSSYNDAQSLRIVLDLSNKISYDEFTLQSAASNISRLVIDINESESNNYAQTSTIDKTDTSSPLSNKKIIDKKVAITNNQKPKLLSKSVSNQVSLRSSDKISFNKSQIQQKADESEVLANEKAQINRELRIQVAKEQVGKIQAAREQAAREQAAREQAAREQAAREQAAREQAAREQAAREQAAREQADRAQANKQTKSQKESMPYKEPRDWFVFDLGFGITSGSYCGTCFTYELGIGLKFTDYLSVRSSYLNSFSLDFDSDVDITINETTWRLTSPNSGLFLEMGSGDFESNEFSSAYDWSTNQYYFWDYDSEVDIIGIGRSTNTNDVSSGWKLKSYSPKNNTDTIYYFSGFVGLHF
jgi:hypothetical protein